MITCEGTLEPISKLTNRRSLRVKYEKIEINNFEAILDESSDEDHALSDDSDYNSDQSEDLTEIVQKTVFHSEIIALNGRTKFCAIYFYYSTGSDYAVCASCMIAIADTDYGYMYAVRKHVTELYDVISGRSCSNCRQALYQKNMENSEQTERDLLELLHQVATLGEYFAWAQRCEEFIKQLEESSRIKRPRLSIGVWQSLVARIARLEGARTRLERQFIYSGGNYNGDCNTAERLIWREIDTAFESRILTGAVINYNHIEPRQFLENAKDIVLEHVKNVLKKHFNVKVNTVFNGEFVSGDKRANKSVNTRNCELFRTSDLHEWYERRVVEPTLASLEEFQERDSGWALSRILDLTVNINKYNPMRAGCHIKLPREITMKRAVINVQSKDNACFAWAVVAALYPAARDVGRESSYPHYTTVLNLQNVEFPMTLSQIKKFELYNDISINVYCIEKEKENNIIPIRLSEQKKDRHVNLLYIQDSQDLGHFAWIKNLSRLVSSQLSKRNGQKYICDRYVYLIKICLHYFGSDDKLQSHIVDCREMNECAIRLPSDKDKWLAFNNYNRKERLPFVVYADLECVLRKTDGDPRTSTYTFQHHQEFSVAYYVHCSYDESLSAYHSRRSTDCVSWFVEKLKNLAQRVKTILTMNVPMYFTIYPVTIHILSSKK
ncbi:uncharacterized protein [Polyergus mexicanus]|uniref:uncharacterized protein n=1 Tax=Polyergus mexicanus TaxID=615972 RepID=UPI0038B46223